MYADRLDLRQLDAFAAVMSAGSITGAARMLGRSQPAVTRLIQDLEGKLGYAVLRRSGPRIAPTERGVLFYEEVERLLQSFRHASECARAIGQTAVRPVEIAATPALSVSLVPAALAAIDASLLPARIHVSAVAAERVVQDVVSRTADFGLATLPFEESGIDVHWVAEAPCVAVMRADDQLASKSIVSLRDLRERRVLTLASRLRQRINDVLARARIEAPAIIETNASSAALAMAREGLGVAIVEPATAHGLPLEGLTIRPLDTLIPFLVGAFSPAGKPLSPTLIAFNDALLAKAQTLLPGFKLRAGASTRDDAAMTRASA
ncbi:LysR family transcriptional regulator [Terrarubrum flagellatum]|uniref:LysR family transcriptional regulator n=1 Tax=Terrirubrum flagellatum TaxID=2895980 RepID=UPI0031452F0A